MMDGHDYVINCKEINEGYLVGLSIREIVNWAINKVIGNESALVIIGETGSGKTTALLLIMNKLRELGIPTVYMNAYNELGLRAIKMINCHNDSNARVLLVDDIDAVFTMPKMAQGLINKVIGFSGTVIASLTIPLLIGNELDTLEPLVRFLRSASRMAIRYRDDEIKAFAKRIGITSMEPTMRTPGMILRNFKRWSGDGNSVVGKVLSDRDNNVVL